MFGLWDVTLAKNSPNYVFLTTLYQRNSKGSSCYIIRVLCLLSNRNLRNLATLPRF